MPYMHASMHACKHTCMYINDIYEYIKYTHECEYINIYICVCMYVNVNIKI